MLSSQVSVFHLTFFGGFASQRQKFFEATEFAPLPLDPCIATQLDALGRAERAWPDRPEDESLWRSCLFAIRPLILRSILWNSLLAVVLSLAVIASRDILEQYKNLSWAFLLCVLVFFSDVFKACVQYYEVLRRVQIARGLQVHLINIVNRKLLRLDPSLSGDLSRGNLKTIVSSDVEAVEDFFSAAVSNWVPTAVLLLILTPVIVWNVGALGLVGILISLIQAPLAFSFAKYIERFQGRSQVHQDQLTTLIGEWVRNIRLVRYLGWQPTIERDIASLQQRYTLEGAYKHFMLCVTYGVSTSWWMVPIVGMLACAKLWGIPLDLAGFFASIWALNHLTNHIQHIPYSISMYASAVAGVKRIDRLRHAPELVRFLREDTPACRPEGIPVRMHLRNVSFSIDETVIIRELTLTLDLTRRTAVVGSVGSGKSILLDLIGGERAPTSGEIEVEYSSGLRANLWCREVYDHVRSLLAVAPQQPFLSNSSIRTNISLVPDDDLAAVTKAAAHASLDSDISLFARGYEEEVGETGINLSGGQKQRVSLARAFFSERPIYLLDDPLSAVDRKTERLLMQSILNSAQGLVIVSHRLDELSLCDRIIVLEAGKLVEDNTPEVLLDNPDSAFVRFLQAHASGEEGASNE